MGSLYFEDVEVGDSCTAGPYLVTKAKSFSSLSSMIRCPATSTSKPRRVQFLGG